MKDNVGRYRTQSLFREFYVHTSTGLAPIWTLKDEDPQGELPSLKRIYLDYEDPTEYSFAMATFGNWQHWLKIKNSKAIQLYIEDWPIELEVRLKSKGILGVAAELTGKNAFSAAKFLANKGWQDTASKRGRPSKEEIAKETKIAAKLQEEVSDDMARIGLSLVSSGGE
jgi:hypothetical protein